MTPKDINEAVDDSFGWSYIANMDEGDSFALKIDDKAVLAIRGGSSEIHEGDIWQVIEIDGRYFKKTGYHMSHDGTYWDGSVSEVLPKQKTITVYERA